MLKTERRKELERKEDELFALKMDIQNLKHWCAEDSGEIAFAMLYLENRNESISSFRDKLRRGLFTFNEYRNSIK